MGWYALLALSMPLGLEMTRIGKPETNTIVNRREREKNGLCLFELKYINEPKNRNKKFIYLRGKTLAFNSLIQSVFPVP